MSAIDTIVLGSTRRLPAHVLAMVAAVANRVEAMAAKHRSRRALLALNDSQLKDIGLSRADAFGEAKRPFWD